MLNHCTTSFRKKSNLVVQDVPFDHDTKSPRFLEWIIIAMVFLASLSLAGLTVLQDFTGTLASSINQGFSVELSPTEGNTSNIASEVRRQENILKLLKRLPGMQRAEVISQASIDSFAHSWLGVSKASNISLPKPTLIDVMVQDIQKIDLKALETALHRIAPGTIVHSSRKWHDDLINIANSALVGAVLITFLIVLLTVLATAFSAHTGLIVYHRVIEVLRLVGAENLYIARQFQRYALWLGLKSGAKGVGLTILFIVSVLLVGQYLTLPDLMQSHRWFWTWGILATIPFVISFVMMVVARATVVWELSKLP